MCFSIIIPVYKVEKYIHECIRSILAQNFSDYEIVLVDDGSPDKCPEICDSYAEEYHNIKVIHKENGGLSEARNVGIMNATGEYILFIDSDDYWDSTTLLSGLSSAINMYSAPDIVMFQGKKLFEESGKTITDTKYNVEYINSATKDDVVKHIITTQSYSMSACTKAINRRYLLGNNVFFEKGLLGEDLDWFFRVVTSAESIKAIDQNCYVYRIREGSITTTIGLKNELDQIKTIRKWKKELSCRTIDRSSLPYYFSILSYAYVVALLNYGRLGKNDKKKIFNQLKEEKEILKYAANKKSRLTKIFVDLLGIRPTSFLLNCYYSMKNS